MLSRRTLTIPTAESPWCGASLVHALELDLNREENTALRWLVISYWVTLCAFDAITSNVEALMASNPDDVIWLVACALWVQWASGQATTQELREALARVRVRHSGLDRRLATIVAGPPGAAREAAEIAERLLADPSRTLVTSANHHVRRAARPACAQAEGGDRRAQHDACHADDADQRP